MHTYRVTTHFSVYYIQARTHVHTHAHAHAHTHTYTTHLRMFA